MFINNCLINDRKYRMMSQIGYYYWCNSKWKLHEMDFTG